MSALSLDDFGDDDDSKWVLDGAVEGVDAGFDLPQTPILNVGNVLARLDLLGTYDLSGNSVFAQASNSVGVGSGAPAKPGSVTSKWTSPKSTGPRGTRDQDGSSASIQKRISNGTQPPPAANDRPSSLLTPQKQGVSPPSSGSSEQGGAGIVKWLTSSTGSPEWLKGGSTEHKNWLKSGSSEWLKGGFAEQENGLRWSSVFGVLADGPKADDSPLLAKLKEKGPPKTLCKNLPRRETGVQTPFGRDRPKLLLRSWAGSGAEALIAGAALNGGIGAGGGAASSPADEGASTAEEAAIRLALFSATSSATVF